MNHKQATTLRQKTKPTSATSSTSEAPQDAATVDALQQLFGALAPLLDFHKQVADAQIDDLRMYWDVRVIRGSAEPFITVTGSSSLTGALGPKQISLASAVLQQEVMDKIATPLVAKMQDIAETYSVDVLIEKAEASEKRLRESAQTEAERVRLMNNDATSGENATGDADAALLMSTQEATDA